MHLFHSEVSCSTKHGLLQRCNPVTKAGLLVVLVVFVSTSNHVLFLWPIAALLLILLTVSGTKMLKVLPLVFLPLFTSFLFASYTGLDRGLTLARSAVGVLSAFMFFLTTPIYDLLAVFTRFLPVELADGVYLTYRTLFIFGERIAEALQGLEIRGLYQPRAVLSNLGVMASVLGNVLYGAMDSAERMGQVIVLRGISGLLRPEHQFKALSWWDAVPISLCVVVMLLMVVRTW